MSANFFQVSVSLCMAALAEVKIAAKRRAVLARLLVQRYTALRRSGSRSRWMRRIRNVGVMPAGFWPGGSAASGPDAGSTRGWKAGAWARRSRGCGPA